VAPVAGEEDGAAAQGDAGDQAVGHADALPALLGIVPRLHIYTFFANF
jgi:hypothetical protein